MGKIPHRILPARKLIINHFHLTMDRDNSSIQNFSGGRRGKTTPEKNNLMAFSQNRKGGNTMHFNRKLFIGAAILAICALSVPSVMAQALPGGTLDPTTIPKYVTPLVIPPVMNNSGTANDYDIAVRQFQQQILPGGIWATLNPAITAPLPATTVWSYGPATDPVPDSSGALGGGVGIAPAPNSQFNYPSYTIEATVNTPSTVDWINDLVDDAGNALPHLLTVDQSLHWANPLADCSSGEVRTDCSSDSAAPYTGPVPIITHVHGSHLSADSDGYTEAWWLPDANNITCVPRDSNGVLTAQPTGYDAATNTWNVACEGTIANQLTARDGSVTVNTNVTPGVGNFEYQNDQPSTTIWYHDHSLGMTRLNVYAGPAGFWLLRETSGGETGLTGILPSPAPVYGEDLVTTNFPAALGGSREKYREIPIAIQDRSFNADGSLFYPDNRAFFEGLNVAGTAGTPDAQFPGAPELQIDMDPATSDIAPIWNPEAFFNTMVVNGVTWPVQEVAPAQYRFRLLNGCNSRFLNLALMITDAAGNPLGNGVLKSVWVLSGNGEFKLKKPRVRELDFFQIGAEQSLLPQTTAIRTGFATALAGPGSLDDRRNVVKPVAAPSSQQALLMGLAERADVIVDFRGLPDGTIITMTNTAPDAPFGGFPDVPADPTTTGQVMQFVVNNALLGASPTDELRDPVTGVIQNPTTAASNPEDLVIDPAALDNFTVAVTNPTPRELALVEEESTLICADVDLAGNVVQLPAFTPVAGACQDAAGNVHPTALPFAPKAAVLGTVDAAGVPTVTLWSAPIATNVNADGSGDQSAEQWNIWNFTVDGHPIHIHLVKFSVLSRSAIGGGPSVVNTATGIQAWENGWKDTVISYPGEITSVAADFDINGLYVWHCHIVEHEDNEMMVPMCVGVAGTDCPAQLF
jgi:FtsP/CotA-like multicopper oxidase with cupredoxin domain